MPGKGSRQKRRKQQDGRKFTMKRKKGRGDPKDKSKIIKEAQEKKAASLEAKMIVRLKEEESEFLPMNRQKRPKLRTSSNNKLELMGANEGEKRKRKKNKSKSELSKISLPTNSRDYGGTIDMPETVTQRQYESTGQFFRRLDRLVAKAKVEASMAARFDYDITKKTC